MPACFQRPAHRREVGQLGDHLEDVLVGGDVLGARLDRHHQIVFGVARGVDQRSCPSSRTGRPPSRARRGCRRAWRRRGARRRRCGCGCRSAPPRAPPRRRGRSPRRARSRSRRPRRPRPCLWRSRARCCPSASRLPWPWRSPGERGVAGRVAAAVARGHRDRRARAW